MRALTFQADNDIDFVCETDPNEIGFVRNNILRFFFSLSPDARWNINEEDICAMPFSKETTIICEVKSRIKRW